MTRKSAESARLIFIKSRLEMLISTDLHANLERLAEQTIAGSNISINQLDDGLKVLLGEVAGEWVLSMVCQLDTGPLDEMASICGLDERVQRGLRQFIARYGAKLESLVRGKVLCSWRSWLRVDPRGHKDYEMHLSTIDGHQFACQLDRQRAWGLIGEILTCLARGGELPEGLSPEIVQRFAAIGETPHGD